MGLSPTDIFEPFRLENAKGIIAAVSGGSDSLALLFLLKDYLATMDNPPPLTAVTIDHRLRDESTLEAESVGQLCKQNGIAHRILAWEEVKPKTGVAAAARSARYRLLVQAACEAGADFIVTGHTRNDQIETFLMRKERSSHSQARGLAAMAPRSRLENSVVLMRPLLETSRSSLRQELSARGVVWFDDPSNVNTNYERPRVRFTSAAEANPDQVLAQIALASMARKRDNAALIAALSARTCLQMNAFGTILVDASIYSMLPENVRRLFAGLLASLAGGRRFLPGETERSRIERLLSGQEKVGRLTVFGALVELGKNGEPHRFRRERRNLPVMQLDPGEAIIWDGRYRLKNETEKMFEVAAPERQELAGFMEESAIDVDFLQREGLLVLPAIYENGKLLCVPAVDGQQLPAGITIEKHFAIFDHVLHGYDFGLAKAIEARFGRECPNFINQFYKNRS
ncbi:tRNA lysidine(34) synthetase TilS [Brucella gallinifaecis]|uniref:tRNA(Ile)-lysidine synthase n=1 Tax=Brucella gallinifaecis TaxID=215590 RepID=A0A502BNN4_9HYPH|nr:tRNA lysidine(34) synthetase TilS [Brucella gallinifaecis]TPF74906.1 tRNA lysidine(34) synthetase TilS [Brucella gallinifaecis]